MSWTISSGRSATTTWATPRRPQGPRRRSPIRANGNGRDANCQLPTPNSQVDRLGNWEVKSRKVTVSTQNQNSQHPKLINLGVGSWQLAIGSERVLLDFLFLRLVSRDSQRTKEPAIVRADLE